MSADPITTAAMTPTERIRQRRLRRISRAAFVVYTIALITGTHWPELSMGTSEHPAPSKAVHALAFAGLTVLLVMTGWVRSIWLAMGIAVAWGAITEFTQGTFAVGRTVSYRDIVANVFGIAAAGTWLWALSPVGGPLNRFRLTVINDAALRVLARPWAWVLLIAAAAPVVYGLTINWPLLVSIARDQRLSFMTGGALIGWWLGLSVVLWRMWQVEITQSGRDRRCPGCGNAVNNDCIDDAGAGRCSQCGRAVHRAMWIDAQSIDRRMMRTMLRTPLGITAGLTAMLFALIAAFVLAHHRLQGTTIGVHVLSPIYRELDNLPAQLTFVIDVSVLLIIAAVGVRQYRRLLAGVYDSQHERCRACGHDLRGTPTERGLGRCGECGTAFAVPPP